MLFRSGVLGVLPGIIGLIQATEVLKLAAGIGSPLTKRLLLFNALDMKFRELKLRRDPECPVCGEHPTITRLIDYEQFCGLNSQTKPMHPDEVTVQELQKALQNPKLGIKIIDVREPEEHRIARIEGVPLLPLSQLAHRFNELDPAQQYYIHCKSGMRSLQALEFLRQHRFKHLKKIGRASWRERV